jgi:hypothetical protein
LNRLSAVAGTARTGSNSRDSAKGFVGKRFWRLSRSGVFEAFLKLLAETSKTAHVVQFFDSTVVRAHVSAAGTKATVLRVKRRFAF